MNAPTTKAASLGLLKISVRCSPQPPLVFFRAGSDGPDKQLLVEVLAETEPQVVPLDGQHVVAQGEGIRIQADGWTRSFVAGAVAFTVDLRSTSGVALRWAPSVDGERVFRNSLLGGTWGVPETEGGWPHQSAAPAPGANGGAFVLDFRYGATHWEVWVDGERQKDFDFPHR